MSCGLKEEKKKKKRKNLGTQLRRDIHITNNIRISSSNTRNIRKLFKEIYLKKNESVSDSFVHRLPRQWFSTYNNIKYFSRVSFILIINNNISTRTMTSTIRDLFSHFVQIELTLRLQWKYSERIATFKFNY